MLIREMEQLRREWESKLFVMLNERKVAPGLFFASGLGYCMVSQGKVKWQVVWFDGAQTIDD